MKLSKVFGKQEMAVANAATIGWSCSADIAADDRE